jgi:hypothetical protein
MTGQSALKGRRHKRQAQADSGVVVRGGATNNNERIIQVKYSSTTLYVALESL